MRARHSSVYVAVTLLAVGVVAGAAIAQAVREHSWQPIWSVGWLPAVLVATLGSSTTRRACARRPRRRARS